MELFTMKQLFGTDGVRGEAGTFLTAQLAMKIAMAAGIYFKAHSNTNKILIGKDTRRSGYMIENAIVAGLTAIGYDVIQIGPMPTPAIAFITENMRCDAGIMISASHNSYEDNGIKIVLDKKSLLYLVGTELDFSGGLNGKGFVFVNPNASRTCGCGESFSI